jgi:hypothetical protein
MTPAACFETLATYRLNRYEPNDLLACDYSITQARSRRPSCGPPASRRPYVISSSLPASCLGSSPCGMNHALVSTGICKCLIPQDRPPAVVNLGGAMETGSS